MTTTLPGAPQVPAPPYPAALTVHGAPWRSPFARDGQVLLARPEFHIGRTAGNDLVINDPGVSRIHCLITWIAQGYVLQDAGSANGTFVDGRRITRPVLLQPGQRIGVGFTTLDFAPLAAPRPQPAPPIQPQAPQPPGQTALPIQPQVQPQTQVAPAIPFTPPPQRGGLMGWLAAQKSKRWWRLLLVGLGAYALLTVLLDVTDNPHMVPLVMLLGASIVPLVFVRFCWEEGAFADMPLTALGPVIAWGSVMGLFVAGALEPLLVWGTGIFSFLMVGLIEQGSQIGSALWATRKMRLRSEFDGLVIGATAGMGFAAFETAGYGFDSYDDQFARKIVSYVLSHPSISHLVSHAIGAAFLPAVTAMTGTLILRMVLAVFGHVSWTAIIGAAIWRERQRLPALLPNQRGFWLGFRRALTVLKWSFPAWFTVVVLHALFDRFTIFAFPLVFTLDIVLLNFFIHESIARGKQGANAPPPPPLGATLLAYVRTVYSRIGQMIWLFLILAALVAGFVFMTNTIGIISGPLILLILIIVLIVRSGHARAVAGQWVATVMSSQPSLVLSSPPAVAAVMSESGSVAPAEAGLPTVHCPECGATCPGNSHFCWNCGAQLSAGGS